MKTKWKVLLLVFCVVFAMTTLSACRSSSPSRLIVGEWSDGDETWTFSRNGTFRLREDGYSVSGTWRVLSDDTLDIIFPGYVDSFRWSSSGSNIGIEEWYVTSDRLHLSGWGTYRKR